MKLRLIGRVLVAAAFLTFTIAALAQVNATEAQLNGLVRDQTGSVIVKASVSLRSLDTNHVYTTASNSVGLYILTNLPAETTS